MVDNRRQYREKFAAVHAADRRRAGHRHARRRLLPVGADAGSPTPNSPAGCSPTIMSSFCPAAFSPAKRGASIRAPVSCASRWSPRSPNASKPPTAFDNLLQQL